MDEIITFLSIISVSAIVTVILIFFARDIKKSCIVAIIIVEGVAMLHSLIVDGSVSTFGYFPYLIALPFLMVGSVLGALVWLFVIAKFVEPK